MNWLIQTIGIVLVLLALADIFLTVLYPRSNKGVISTPLSKLLWQLFRFAAKITYCDRDLLLSYCGPVLLVLIVTVWVSLLNVGFALIVWPAFGSEIQSSQGATPTDFMSALYYSGYALTTLGVGSIVPKTGIYKLLIILEAALGFATFTLTLTYFLSVYSALTRRNTFALSLYHRNARSADAGVIITRMVAETDLNPASAAC